MCSLLGIRQAFSHAYYLPPGTRVPGKWRELEGKPRIGWDELPMEDGKVGMRCYPW